MSPRWNPAQPELVEREHDLPPLWDGEHVVWQPWEAPLVAFVCPPRKGDRECPRCRSTAPQPQARGWLGGIVQLVAFRCPDCQLDQVVHDGTWILDPSDYGGAGSVAS